LRKRRFPLRLLTAVLLVAFSGACASRRPPAPAAAASRPVAAQPGAFEEGVASWYGGKDGFEGKPTASGEIYDGNQMTAAHRTLPLGTWIEVRNLENGRTARLRINDRGPFARGRILDLSRTAAGALGVIGPGTAPIRLTVVQPGVEAPPVSPTGLWAVQVGSFAESGRAQRFSDRLRATGREIYLEPYRGLTRVKVGPYPTREKAQDALDRLENEGFEGIVVPSVK
jgi:peptidoglycan lytic transglycosylase